nr:hypothetical protein [Campylobacter sp.]
DYNNEKFAVKSFKIPNIFSKILYYFGKRSKAKKSYEHAIKIGGFTPKPIGYIEFYKGIFLHESFYVSENFDYDFSIREPLLDPNFADRENILKLFVEFSFSLHENEILHLDYSPGNILIKKNQEKYEFKIIDINRMKFKSLNLNERLKNFSMLWANDEDMKFIAIEYARLSGADESECITKAVKFSHELKARKNFKKFLKRR